MEVAEVALVAEQQSVASCYYLHYQHRYHLHYDRQGNSGLPVDDSCWDAGHDVAAADETAPLC